MCECDLCMDWYECLYWRWNDREKHNFNFCRTASTCCPSILVPIPFPPLLSSSPQSPILLSMLADLRKRICDHLYLCALWSIFRFDNSWHFSTLLLVYSKNWKQQIYEVSSSWKYLCPIPFKPVQSCNFWLRYFSEWKIYLNECDSILDVLI